MMSLESLEELLFQYKAMAPPIYQHTSDCAVNNEPAYPAGDCNCYGVLPETIWFWGVDAAYGAFVNAAHAMDRAAGMIPLPPLKPIPVAPEKTIPASALRTRWGGWKT